VGSHPVPVQPTKRGAEKSFRTQSLILVQSTIILETAFETSRSGVSGVPLPQTRPELFALIFEIKHALCSPTSGSVLLSRV